MSKILSRLFSTRRITANGFVENAHAPFSDIFNFAETKSLLTSLHKAELAFYEGGMRASTEGGPYLLDFIGFVVFANLANHLDPFDFPGGTWASAVLRGNE